MKTRVPRKNPRTDFSPSNPSEKKGGIMIVVKESSIEQPGLPESFMNLFSFSTEEEARDAVGCFRKKSVAKYQIIKENGETETYYPISDIS